MRGIMCISARKVKSMLVSHDVVLDSFFTTDELY
jgi:hypothetical protein